MRVGLVVARVVVFVVRVRLVVAGTSTFVVRVGLIVAGVSVLAVRVRLVVIGVGILKMSSGLIAVTVVSDEMRVRSLRRGVEILCVRVRLPAASLDTLETLERRCRLIEIVVMKIRRPKWGFGAIAMKVRCTAVRAAGGMMTAGSTMTRPRVRSART